MKHLVNLRKNKGYRHEQRSVVVLGKKLVQEFLDYGKAIITCNDQIPISTTLPIYQTTQTNLQKITGVEHPESIAMEISFPPTGDLHTSKKIIIADKLQDPGNLGTLMRSALAFGFNGIYLIEPIVDPYNDKVIRSSKGAIFHMSMQLGSEEECLQWVKQHRYSLFSADLQGQNLSEIKIDTLNQIALIVGNEARGVDPIFKEEARAITIPIQRHVESLNVATAASIIMYQLGMQI